MARQNHPRRDALLRHRQPAGLLLDDFPMPPWATGLLVENVIGSDNVRELICLELELD
jgi:hypothetical protein